MKARYRLIRRGERGTFYCFDTHTSKRTSLATNDRAEAARLISARNEAHQQPALNFHIARAYLLASDPEMGKRTWQHVMEEILKLKAGETRYPSCETGDDLRDVDGGGMPTMVAGRANDE